MTEIGIHYTSPPEDPLKVPRPHWVRLDPDRPGTARGGEIGAGLRFLGFTRIMSPEDFARGDWIDYADIVEDISSAARVEGWFAAFVDADDDAFTCTLPVSRVTVAPL